METLENRRPLPASQSMTRHSTRDAATLPSTRCAPAVVIRSATRRAVIGTRGATLRSSCCQHDSGHGTKATKKDGKRLGLIQACRCSRPRRTAHSAPNACVRTLSAVAVVGYNGRDTLCRGALESVQDDEQLHHVVIDRRRRGLNEKHVLSAHVLRDGDPRLAIRELGNLCLRDAHAQRPRNLLREPAQHARQQSARAFSGREEANSQRGRDGAAGGGAPERARARVGRAAARRGRTGCSNCRRRRGPRSSEPCPDRAGSRCCGAGRRQGACRRRWPRRRWRTARA